MTAKEYLGQAFHIDQRINMKLDQVIKLRESVTKATMTLSDMPRSDSPNQQSMEGIIVKIIDMENEINSDIDRLVDLKREISSTIGRMDRPEYQMILESRYLCYKSWEQIALEMHYNLRWVFRLHGRALMKLESLLQEEAI